MLGGVDSCHTLIAGTVRPPIERIGALAFLVVVIYGTMWVWNWFVPLKRVWLGESELRCSNYLVEETIALTNVSGIRLMRTRGAAKVVIELGIASRFGDSIVFMPPWSASVVGEQSVVEEIEAAVRMAKRR